MAKTSTKRRLFYSTFSPCTASTLNTLSVLSSCSKNFKIGSSPRLTSPSKTFSKSLNALAISAWRSTDHILCPSYRVFRESPVFRQKNELINRSLPRLSLSICVEMLLSRFNQIYQVLLIQEKLSVWYKSEQQWSKAAQMPAALT